MELRQDLVKIIPVKRLCISLSLSWMFVQYHYFETISLRTFVGMMDSYCKTTDST